MGIDLVQLESQLKRSRIWNHFGGRASRLYYEALRNALVGCQSLLDAGCGVRPNIGQVLGIRRNYLCDTHLASLVEAKKDGRGIAFAADVKALPIKPNSVDAVLLLQVLEHLEKDDGLKLLCTLEQVARRVIIVSTPNGYVRQDALEGNLNQVHQSGWDVDELRSLGYLVMGYEGFKLFKIPGTSVCRCPSAFFTYCTRFGLFSGILRRFPALAFQLIAVKHL